MTTQHLPEYLEELICHRRTIHEFKEEPVPAKDIIKQAINAARWAPNHYLTEPWHFYLLGRESIKSVINLNTELVREKSGDAVANSKHDRWSKIPGWLVLTCDKSSDPVRSQEDYAACCCAVQNFMLYLWSKDIGVKWTTGTLIRDSRFYELLWIDPRVETVVGILWYGYAKVVPETVRKPLEQILVELP